MTTKAYTTRDSKRNMLSVWKSYHNLELKELFQEKFHDLYSEGGSNSSSESVSTEEWHGNSISKIGQRKHFHSFLILIKIRLGSFPFFVVFSSACLKGALNATNIIER